MIDQGVDLDHDDLNANLLTGYDATDGGLGGDNGDCWGNDAHGTCCAGIIASVDNLIGTIGVSSGCSIVPIRITYFDYPYDVWDDDWIVDGINHAWEDSGADILSCSWGGGRSITAVNNEISAALDEGRDDLGCIFVFSTGNANSDVLWPANSNPDIIAVGAMNPWGKRKSPTSDDTEDTWGSNFGDELDIVAPGVLIPTTDIEGSAGYNTQYFIHGENGGTLVDEDYDDEDYTVCFNGTSSAVPHVSGVAALILSVNPYLTQDQVRNIIESTAQKVGGYSYTTTQGRTNGTWDDEMGYGLLDAYNAVIKAAGGPISGESVVCSTGETFSIYPLASFDSIKWEIGPYLSIYSGQGTSSCTIRSTNNGSSYVTVTVYANGHQTTLPEMIVWSGVPLFTSISDPNPPYIYKGCTGEQYTFHSNPARDPDSQSSYQWMVEPGYYDWYFMYQYYDWVTIVFNDPYDYYQVIARASNVCGSSSWVSTLYSFGYIAMMDCYYFSMYPNPASDYITITLTVPETVQNFVKPADYTVQIIDNSGITCYSATRVEDSFTIPVISYKDGTYLVVIKYGDKIETLPLIVKH